MSWNADDSKVLTVVVVVVVIVAAAVATVVEAIDALVTVLEFYTQSSKNVKIFNHKSFIKHIDENSNNAQITKINKYNLLLQLFERNY